MSYRIEEVDIRVPEILVRLKDLFRLSFDEVAAEKDLLKNTSTRNGKTIYIATFFGENLVAFTAFIAHEVIIDAQNVLAYQMCWGCTHPNHQAKGLFVNLINYSKSILKQRGAAFLFGYPNHLSYPVFINKLGFREEGMRKINIPLFGGIPLYKAYLKPVNEHFVLPSENVILANQSELIDLKLAERGDIMRWYGNFNNVIWGKIRTRKTLGTTLRFFKVGGMVCNKPHLLKHTIKELITKEKPHFLQFVVNESNSYLNLFNSSSIAHQVEPLVVFDLDLNTSGSSINFFNGIKDVF